MAGIRWVKRTFAITQYSMLAAVLVVSLIAGAAPAFFINQHRAQAQAAVLFSDNFERGNSSTLGNGWVEVEPEGGAVGLSGGRMCFTDTSDLISRPIVRRSFTKATSGLLEWTFDFDWKRKNPEYQYRLLMQLGDSAQMSDDSQHLGIGVHLLWEGFGGPHETLAARRAGVSTPLQVVSGPAQVRVTADLDAHTYDVRVNGVLVGSGLPFDHEVDIDTVRFMTHELAEQNFLGRCFDNLLITGGTGSPAPTATSAPATTAPPTSTRTPTGVPPATATNTPLPTATFTAQPSFTPTQQPASPTSSNPTGSGSLFADNFERGNSSTLGNGWVEVEPAGGAVGLSGGRMCFTDTSDLTSRPLVRRSFARISSGLLEWTFDFDWKRKNPEHQYRLLMQLGDSAQMNDDSQHLGIGVHLLWEGFGGPHETLAARKAGVSTPLQVVSGAAQIRVTANLDAHTYDVRVNGVLVGSGLPFDHEVDIDTVRFMTHELAEQNFLGRCFDNLSITGGTGSPAPTATSAPATTAPPTPTRTPTGQPSAAATNTPQAPAATSTPPVAACTVRIMPLGDSITKGTGTCSDPAGQDCTGYREPLYDLLVNAGYAVDFVGSLGAEFQSSRDFDTGHEGHGGKTAHHIRNVLYNGYNAFPGQFLISSAQPDIVLLHVGTNDISDGELAPRVNNEIGLILNEIDQYENDAGREVLVILAQIINRSDPQSTMGLETSAFNDRLYTLSRDRIRSGDRLVLVDMESALHYPADLTDTVHPNQSGYIKMASAWFNALLPELAAVCP
ncbi:MAG: hypothetical protein GX495_06855 [Chloroflexi bacterium]|mgnify:CR=1 FL=1|nr:hypothetical protein [Chloroflexota bacterium]